ncbi:hypothetical protein ONE63_009568 [Megalurothrips usitatus]|uniref:Ubiquitin carboxyl-terminal hydrolase 36 n=1 Tax=Megalurothrips usitatus TaxID=439358 RepID=A0AAV7XK21_9NEOP|nr:hypothetical protein ONE63_009568 [Megalurothrips usitatus]
MDMSCSGQGDASPLLRVHKEFCPAVQAGQQADAHEFLVLHLEKLESEYLNRFGSELCSMDPSTRQTTPLHYSFEGRLRTQVECQDCCTTSTTSHAFTMLDLEVRHSKDVVQALHRFSQCDTVEFFYGTCKRSATAEKRVTIEKLPLNLLVRLERFAEDGCKIESNFNLVDKLDVSFCTTGRISSQMSLNAVIFHAGESTRSGHYYATVRNGNKFMKFDDDKVTAMSWSQVKRLRDTSYVLVYAQ